MPWEAGLGLGRWPGAQLSCKAHKAMCQGKRRLGLLRPAPEKLVSMQPARKSRHWNRRGRTPPKKQKGA